MAYRGRGGSIKEGLKNAGNDSNEGNILNRRIGYRPVLFINYGDYFLYELISIILIVVIIGIGVLARIFYYESPYIFDPIENVKNNFIDLQFLGLILNGIFLGIAIAKRKISKNSYKFFIATFCTLLITVIITAFGCANFIDKFNSETFSDMYTENYMKVDVTGDSKQLFIQECESLNEKFIAKVLTICISEYVLLFVNVVLFVYSLKTRKEYDKIQRENEVLFDEEINIKC